MDRARHKIVLVTRRTRLEDLVTRFHTVAQARFYVEHSGADFDDYVAEHEQYVRARLETESALHRHGIVQALDRSLLPNFVFAGTDVVVVLGQDGTVANTLKYLDGHPLIGVNPDPERWDGVLLPFRCGDVSRITAEVLQGRRDRRRVTMARVGLGDGQEMLAVNDLFIGPRTHTSARYLLRAGGEEESQSSSGIIVSTGLGSTGWHTSLLTGAYAIAMANGLGAADSPPPAVPRTPWDADFLDFTVREPFPSRTSGVRLVCGRIARGETLEVVSQMAEGGVIFSDGLEHDFLEFGSGVTARVGLASREGCVVT
jgi:NAD kinase